MILRCLFCLVLLAPLRGQCQEKKPSYYIFSIYFGGGSSYIDPEQIQSFFEWYDGIPDADKQAISIHGHTDDIGSKEYNDWLSHHRSEAALQLLLQRGRTRESISIEDFGELNPVYDNNTWEGKLKNRRVDIIIKPLDM